MSFCCKFSFEVCVVIVVVVYEMVKNLGVDGGGNGFVMFGFEILWLLYWFEGYIIINICGCIILFGLEVMIMVIMEEMFFI